MIDNIRNMTAFQQRFLSSIVMIGAYALLIVSGEWPIKLTFLFLAGALSVEWVKICRLSIRKMSILMIGIIYCVLYLAAIQHPVQAVGLLLCGASLGVFLSWMSWYRRFLWVSLGLLYIGLPCVTIFWLLDTRSSGILLLVWMTTLVAINDTTAYLVGNWLKGPKLIAVVSPSKTWSGFFGGIVCASLVGGVFYFFITTAASLQQFIGICAAVAFWSTIGDLFESKIKRLHKIKDSGDWIPGHGGLLDRLDGLLFVIPAVGGAILIWPELMEFSLRSNA